MKTTGISIRDRMLVWILAVTGIILALVILWSYTTARRRLAEDMETKAVFLADGAARRIDAQLGRLQGVVHGMALALESQQLEQPFAGVREMQDRCLLDYDGIYGICIALDPDLAPADWPDLAAWAYRAGDRLKYTDLAGPDLAHTREDWYTLPMYMDRPIWSEPYEWDGVLMVTYSVPIRLPTEDGYRLAGVVTCDLTLDWLEAALAQLPLGAGGYGLLMSRNGTYIAHPLPEIVLNETVFSIAEARNDPQLRAIGQRMVSGQPGILPFESFATGERSWLAFTPLQSADWIMAALISHAELNAAILHLSRSQGLIGGGGMLLLCLAVAMIARSITRPIRELRDAANTLSGGNLAAPLPAPRGNDEVAQLARTFNEMRERLQHYLEDLRVTTAARERMHSELQIARDIQMGLVPKTFPPFPRRKDLDLHAMIEPAREVGGDFYDFFLLDEDRLVAAIGDVSGKGVPAALFMAVTRSFLRAAFRSETDPALALEHVNNELADGNDASMFVTLFCAVLELSSGRLTFASAGHNPPLVRYPDGHAEYIARTGNLVAGVMAGTRYKSGAITLPRGATLLTYTDGVTEAMDTANQLYGDERLAALLATDAGDGDCRAMIESIAADIRVFRRQAEQSDDITMLAIRRV